MFIYIYIYQCSLCSMVTSIFPRSSFCEAYKIGWPRRKRKKVTNSKIQKSIINDQLVAKGYKTIFVTFDAFVTNDKF